MSVRAEIVMSPEEVRDFLLGERTMICATNGRDGFPHLMPLWYVIRDDEIWGWTYGRSQKVRNMERDPRATIQVEAGTEYAELHGVMLKTEVEVVRDPGTLLAVGMAMAERYNPPSPGDDGSAVRAKVERQAKKHVALRFAERERATWDHRKLASARS